MDFAFLEELCAVAGPPGGEGPVRELMAGKLIALGGSCETDALGNLIAHFAGSGPKVMLQAHMDEVSFLVSRIEDSGILRLMPLGGIDPRVIGGHKLTVHGRRAVDGVIGSVPPHLTANGKEARDKVTPIEEAFLDLGLEAGEVRETVAVGDAVTFASTGWQTPDSFFSKALDDRVGLFVMAEALTRVDKIDCDLYVACSVQEEVGLRGAGPAAFSVQPDIALAVEGTMAMDTPGLSLPSNITPARQGLGPEIRLTDRALTADRELVRHLGGLAGKRGIDHQVIVKNFGTTDATVMQTAARGARSTAVSVPVRYIHAPLGLARKSDMDQTAALLAAFIETATSLPDLS